MTTGRIAAEAEATRSLLHLMDAAKITLDLYEKAGMSVPEPLKRFLDIAEPTRATPRVEVPPPEEPARPQEAGDDWVWIRAVDASPTSLVRAILRRDGQLRAKDVVSKVHLIQPEIISGSILNIGPRLDPETISRDDDGWKLIDPKASPILKDGTLWGSLSMLSSTDITTYRRRGILHILRQFRTGLQLLQIVERLHGCPWMLAPINKDLIKLDMETLRGDGLVKRGSSRKWVLPSLVQERAI